MLSKKALISAEATASASGWDISNAVVDGFSNPHALSFKGDGSKMYVLNFGNSRILEYNLSVGWDISTASYSQDFTISSQDINPFGFFFKPDGTAFYVTVGTQDRVLQYNLSTAWDISSASYVDYFSVESYERNPRGVFFKLDGTKMYILGNTNNKVNEFNLSTAWDITTASYSAGKHVSSQDTFSSGIYFRDDGLKFYFTGSTNDRVYEYNLSTAWSIATASFLQSFYVGTQETTPRGLFFESDGQKMYICGVDQDRVWSYDL